MTDFDRNIKYPTSEHYHTNTTEVIDIITLYNKSHKHTFIIS